MNTHDGEHRRGRPPGHRPGHELGQGRAPGPAGDGARRRPRPRTPCRTRGPAGPRARPLDWWNATVDRGPRGGGRSASGSSGQHRPLGADARRGPDATRTAARSATPSCGPTPGPRTSSTPTAPAGRDAAPPGQPARVRAWPGRSSRGSSATSARRVAAMRWALQPKDWLRLQLTGEVHTEPSDASATLMYDALADTWAADVVEALGINPDVLPPVLPSSGSRGGRPDRGRRRRCSASRPACPSRPVPADTAAAGLGSGLVAPGTAQLTIGTGVQLVTPSEQPVRRHGRPRHALLPRRHRPGSLPDGRRPQRRARPAVGLRHARTPPGPSSTPSAEQPPHADDPLFLPHLNGERTPYLDASMRGAWTGLSAAAHPDRPPAVRARGCRFRRRGGPGQPCSPTVSAVDHLRLAGGGTAAPAWRQLLADVLDVELRAVAVPGASGRGAAFLGARAAGLIDESALLETGDPGGHLGGAPRTRRPPLATATGAPGSDTRSSTCGQAVRRHAVRSPDPP